MIRPATQADVSALVEMLQRFNVDWDYVGKLPIHAEHARDYFSAFIASDTWNTITAISERDGHIAGAMGMLIINSPFTAAPTLYKSFWYAKPEFPGAGRELLRFAKDVARENGVRHFFIGSMHPRVSKLLEREGFKQQEINYVMDF